MVKPNTVQSLIPYEITLPLGESPSQRRRGCSYKYTENRWLGKSPPRA